MDKLFDDIARALASPVPRRRAVKLIAGGLAGAVLAAFGPRRAAAQGTCSPACSGNNPQCCLPIGNFCCPSSGVCCGGNKHCCNPGDSCVANKCQKQNPSPTSP